MSGGVHVRFCESLWVAGITYIRLRREFVYRALLLMAAFGGGWSRLRPFRRLSWRLGCVPAWPYPPLSYFQSGSHQPGGGK